MTSLNHLRLVSYNCRGWNFGKFATSDLLESCDICFVQKHWLLPDHLHLLNINCDFISIGISGMVCTELCTGRPFGGCAIFYRKSLHSSVTRLNSPSKRFCAISLSDDSNFNTLLISVYFPTNYGTDASNDEYLFTLGDLEGFIESQQYERILITGNFNADFDRSNFCIHQL